MTEVDEILNDESINCVVELMGGTGKAKEVVMGAIARGKHVVTANKALVASCLTEIRFMCVFVVRYTGRGAVSSLHT